jgi:quercetin dioxygenase-like cupin family protein
MIPPGIENAVAMPWVPLAQGFSFKLLRATSDDEPWVELLRLEPGTVIPRHRHTGDVHAYTLAGYRELTEIATMVGPGSYVYEPVGNVDSWRATGHQPVIVFVVLRGAIEYLDHKDRVIQRSTATSSAARYHRGCR